MTKIAWTVTLLPDNLNLTNKILSMSINQGREKYLDPYSGGFCTFTINNANNYASNIVYGKEIEVIGVSTGQTYNMSFWVQEVTFDDYPGNTGLSTATIRAADFVSRAGRVSTTGFGLSQTTTGVQLTNLSAGILPADLPVAAGVGSSTASAITYAGTFTNYLNFLIETERGFIYQNQDILTFTSRNAVVGLVQEVISFGPTTSSSQIGYQEFERIQNGLQFINTATISSAGLADQTATNAASVTSKGAAFYSSTTVDATTTQALGNANWIANTFSDPESLRFTCSFTDLAQETYVVGSWIFQTFDQSKRAARLYYRVPGGSLTSVLVMMEGYSINVTPEQTTFDLSFSPLQYYQFFTLDSSTLGILDTSRLGW
jgi:hypothetical protein